MKTLQEGLLLAGLAVQFCLTLAGLRKENLRISYSFFVYLSVSFASSFTVSYLIQDP